MLSVRDELIALLMFCRYQWYVLLAVILAVVIAAYLISPLPPAHIRIASGQSNSTLEVIAYKYGGYFERHGVRVEYLTTYVLGGGGA